MVQWLELSAFTTEGLDSIPKWGTRILQALQHGQIKKKKPKHLSVPRFLYLENKIIKSPRSNSLVVQWLGLVTNKQVPRVPLRTLCACSVVSDSSGPRGLQPPRLLRPWDLPGKNSRVGCHFLLQGVFLTRGHRDWVLPEFE